MARLFRNTEGTNEGKFLVLRRDGSIPQWPYFVIGASDPAAPAALRAYADAGADHGFDPAYLDDLRALADEFEAWRAANGSGDPDAPRRREDNPEIIALMRQAKGAGAINR